MPFSNSSASMKSTPMTMPSDDYCSIPHPGSAPPQTSSSNPSSFYGNHITSPSQSRPPPMETYGSMPSSLGPRASVNIDHGSSSKFNHIYSHNIIIFQLIIRE